MSRQISARSVVVGVVGDPVHHSLSPLLHNAAFEATCTDAVSVGFLVKDGAFQAALEGLVALGVRGVSVTMPHKEAAAKLAAVTSPLVDRLGAANCLVVTDGHVHAHSTDGAGFLGALHEGAQVDLPGMRAMVAGTGGAARAIIAALCDAGAEVHVVSRSTDRAVAAAKVGGATALVGRLEEFPTMDLVVNATPCGMAGTSHEMTGPFGDWVPQRGQVAFDAVYQPRQTRWLLAAAAQGATVVGGLSMLVHQAIGQLVHFTGCAVDASVLWQALEDHGARG